MPHPIEQRIVETRRKAARLLLIYGVSWVAGSLVAAIVLLGLVDYLIRFDDPGIRALSTLAVLLAAGWTTYRYLYPALAVRLRDVEIAQRIERRFPGLQDRLASAVEFLHQDEHDPQAGSAALRRAVIVDTTDAVQRLNLDDVLERRPANRALAGAAAVLALALGIVICDPLSARLALARLARPFGDDAWPRKNHLEFIDPPQRIAAGQTFEVELRDKGGPPPAEIRIHYLYDNDGHATEEVESMHLLGGVPVARKENVARPFKYRAEGGDDRSMAWISLEVVEPPRVESLQATLHPPAYTGWPVERVENNLSALRGTRVALAGSSTKRLTRAAVRTGGAEPIPCALDVDGFLFTLPADAAEPFLIENSGTYSFELVDTEGLIGGGDTQFEIRAVADQAPSVQIEQPTATLFVTPAAVVQIKVAAKDDLAIHEMALHFSRSGTAETPDSVVPLYTSLPAVEPTAAGLAGGGGGDTRVVEYSWEIGPLDLKPGSQVTFYASASDYLPQTGRSTDRRLVVITPQELEDRLAQRQGLILSELRRALKMQQDTRGQTAAIEIQLREVGRLGKQDIDHAQGAELSQRQVTRTLTSPTEGVPAQINELLADLENNRVDNADVARRMQAMLAEIERLQSEHLGPIEHHWTSAIKSAQVDLDEAAAGGEPNRPQRPDVAANLEQVAANQDEVIRSLESMLGNLAEWDSYRRFGRDVAQIDREQEDLERGTRQAAGKTLGKDLKDLDSQQIAELKKTSARQADLARRFDKLLQQMDEARGRLESSDPLAGATLADALQLAREQGTSGRHALRRRPGRAQPARPGWPHPRAGPQGSRRNARHLGQPPRARAGPVAQETPPGRARTGHRPRAAPGSAQETSRGRRPARGAEDRSPTAPTRAARPPAARLWSSRSSGWLASWNGCRPIAPVGPPKRPPPSSAARPARPKKGTASEPISNPGRPISTWNRLRSSWLKSARKSKPIWPERNWPVCKMP